MSNRRRPGGNQHAAPSARGLGGLGRGLGALIPSGPPSGPPGGRPRSGDHAPDTDPVPGPAPFADADRPPVVDPPQAEATAPGTPDDSPPSSSRLDHATDDGQAAGGHATVQLRDVPGARLIEVALTDVRANARQPRTVFDEQALAELAHSIAEFGVLQPIVVRETPDGPTDYELVMGERRLRAAQVAGLERVPAIVRGTADDAMLRDALLENIHRAALNPLEEAAAYQQLLEEFGVTHDELAQQIGRSRSQVSNTIRLLQLPVAVQRRVAAGVLSAGHARALLGLADGRARELLAARIVAEGLSVRATEELVALGVADDPPAAARRRPRALVAPALAELADKLSDTFDTRVRVELGRRKGKISVEFATVDDLERIVALMAPALATQRPPYPGDPVQQPGDPG